MYICLPAGFITAQQVVYSTIGCLFYHRSNKSLIFPFWMKQLLYLQRRQQCYRLFQVRQGVLIIVSTVKPYRPWSNEKLKLKQCTRKQRNKDNITLIMFQFVLYQDPVFTTQEASMDISTAQITHLTTTTILIVFGLLLYQMATTYTSALIISIWRVVLEVALTTTCRYMTERLTKA